MKNPTQTQPVAAPQSLFTQRLIAEAVRIHEDREGRVIEDSTAWKAGRETAGDLEARVLARAAATRLGGQVKDALQGVRRLGTWMGILALLLAGLVGMGAASASLGAPLMDDGSRVNIFWTLGSLLGVQTLMLLLWLLVMLLLPRAGGGLLGHGVLGVGGGLARWLSRAQAHELAVRALINLLGRGGLARWSAGSVTHLLWAAFGAGALLMCIWSLSVRQYDFAWGTTLLSETHFITLIHTLGALPSWLGIPVPDEALIHASRLGVSEGAGGRIAWSGFLLGSLLFYGLLPRLLLGLLCLGLARRSAARSRADLTAPGYARLAPRLQPDHHRLGVIDPPPASLAPQPASQARRNTPDATVPMALIGFELEHARNHWIQKTHHARCTPLGQVDDRQTRRDILAALAAQNPAPSVVVVVCSLARTPDRSAEGFLADLRSRTTAPVWLLLDEASVARGREIDLDARYRAWQDLSERACLDRLLPDDPARADHQDAQVLLDAFDHPEDHAS
ncbi:MULTISPECIES: DUF2868 domain-containing protein [unclassified Ectothiorhodospira]|uniref:DUF2868 domain-containing protein n=1 Tax=unclassified Ectothiorhodospira TaxID=2684909 RepID=UPI001EE929DC|nr:MULTISPECIES: DUF2868 domain-containing protein [unclassified Ectothiorhodospira]MCG5516084.1 DUF2868 domain-containing protein [Ectothiorhodospira sp. 9100]MCG5519106.1 DUF2868 domain-containing protein [Ectothiorhodospira sp. 9905]